jgi:SAM-dependent methyltransferase
MPVQQNPPVPPRELAERVGGTYDEYRSIAVGQRWFIESVLPAGWSFEGKTVLDFGCGPGRTLGAFSDLAERATFVGCDIHAESVAWARANLPPSFELFVCQETPPLEQPDGRFDLVYAMSVFTHLTYHWSGWLTELHRVLGHDGIAVISVLGPAMASQITGRGWDARVGMAILDLHKDWSIGGPSVLLSDWWIREHWGRAFEILRFEPCDVAAGAGHDLVTLRRRNVPVTPEVLERRNAGDERELAALEYNIELMARQQQRLGAELRKR